MAAPAPPLNVDPARLDRDSRTSTPTRKTLGPTTKINDGVTFRLIPGVDLQVSIHGPTNTPRFGVVGPIRARALLHRLAGKQAAGSTHGRVSPITPISVSDADREKAGIPPSATKYCFAYPLDCLRSDFDTIMASVVGSADHREADEAILMFFLLGGFIYFDDEPEEGAPAPAPAAASVRLSWNNPPSGGAGVKLTRPADGPPRIIAVNALSLSAAATAELFFDGPYAAPLDAVEALQRDGRMCRVTIGRLLYSGIAEFAWVNPKETPGGASLSASVDDYPNGAYVYKMSDERAEPFFYALRPQGKGSGVRPQVSSDVPHAAAIHSAFGDMINSYSMAKSHGAVLQADLALWRTSWWRKWLRTYGVQLGVYYVMGVLVYGHLEGWNPLDVCYFLTTTVTTVGYGDFAPSSYAGRWLTSLYAPLGTVAVISALNPAVDWVLTMVDRSMAWPIAALELFVELSVAPPEVESKSKWGALRSKQRAGNLTDRQQKMRPGMSLTERSRIGTPSTRTWSSSTSTQAPHMVELTGTGGASYHVNGRWGYVHALIGPVLLAWIGVLLSYFYEKYTLVDSVYWTIVTMTTVGYGDITPVGWDQKLYTIFFMPLAATTLTATVDRFVKLNASQRIHRTNFRITVDNMLKEEAMDQKEILPALSEESFILRVLVEENMVEESTLRELKGRYRGMLEHGKGLVRGEGRVDKDGVPKTIDAEVVFYLLVQQGRVVDRNVDGGRETNGRRRAAITKELNERTSTGEPTRRMQRVRSQSAGLARGKERGALTDHGGDVITAVDMSVPDGGFQEWYEDYWVPSLQECGLEPGLADWARYEQFKAEMNAALVEEGASRGNNNNSPGGPGQQPSQGGRKASVYGGVGDVAALLRMKSDAGTRSDGYQRLEEEPSPKLSRQPTGSNAPTASAPAARQGSQNGYDA